MANVQNLNSIAIDHTVEHSVSIASHNLHVDLRIVRSLRCFRIFRDELHARVDRSQYIASTGRTSLLEISINLLDVATRTRRVPNSHSTPYFFQKAFISSSDINSPRRA